METTKLDNDITIFYVTAGSFPSGIMDSHQKLHSMVPFSPGRKYFGISRPENGVIVYRAGTEELQPGEGKKFGCETLVIKKGNYISETISNYQENIESISETFQELLKNPAIDPQGYCVEWYTSPTEVKCMIRLKD
jgi:hypothetical protein